MKPYIESKILVRYTLRMPKDFSSFFYFSLESHENLAFYSTLPHEVGQPYRDIVLRTTPELDEQISMLIDHCKKSGEIEILEKVEEAD